MSENKSSTSLLASSLTYPDHGVRLRRLRQSPGLRRLVQETRLLPADLVLPVFVKSGIDQRQAIASLPGHFHWSIDALPILLDECMACGIESLILFGLPESKDAAGSASWQSDGIVQQALQRIKTYAPNFLCIVDVCFCQYTDHGHCGVLDSRAAPLM